MVIIRFGKWSLMAGTFLVYERIYWNGRWTPFCKISKRYDTWLGYWKQPKSKRDVRG